MSTNSSPRKSSALFLSIVIAALYMTAGRINAQPIDLETSKVDSVDPVLSGQNTNYTISVLNKGTQSAPDVRFTDVLPEGLVFQGFLSITQGIAVFQGETVTATFGAVAPGVTATLVFVVKPNTNFKSPPLFTVSSPASLARDYHVRQAGFSPPILGTTATFQLLAADDGSGNVNDACQDLISANAQAMAGKIGVIRRSGSCGLETAAGRVAAAGAAAVLAVSTNFNLAPGPGTNITVPVPVLTMTKEDGDDILAALATESVSANLSILLGQFLNTVRATTSGTDSNPGNNVAVSYTAFVNDSDGDGLPDPEDKCPGLPNAPQTDFDADGIGDVCDACTDADNDGFGDPGFPLNTCAIDQCVADSAKSAPGICGCGISDADGDGDGTVDCLDQCPADAAKTAPGVCGCGVADADLNANGILDCSITAELGSTLNQALTGLSAIKPKNGKLNKKGKQALESFKILVAKINSTLAQSLGAVQLKDAAANLIALQGAVQKAAQKVSKFRSNSFGKNKKAAAAALNKLLSVLAL